MGSFEGTPGVDHADEIVAALEASRVVGHEQRFAAEIIDCVADPLFVKDREYRFVLVNAALCAMVGFPREELVGKTDYDFFPKEEADFFRQKDEELFVTGARVRIEEEHITDASGGEHVLATIKAPLRDERGTITHLVGIIHDITEQQRAARDLERANRELGARIAEREAALAQLAAVNRELEAFSYSVSHDLRQPLRAIDGFAKALAEDHGATLPPTALGYLERVRAGARRMGELIDDLLGLARLTQVELACAEVDLSAIARDVVASFRASAPTREVEVVIEDGLLALGDAKLLRIALENLLGNAWKFTSKKVRARIELAREPGSPSDAAAFVVRDDGAGFDMAYAGKLFGAFQRLHGAKEFEGTGVGLATVQRIVHRHGGRIWAEGEVDVGAVFHFTLGG
jgi:PAS domain S-box-containing protein